MATLMFLKYLFFAVSFCLIAFTNGARRQNHEISDLKKDIEDLKSLVTGLVSEKKEFAKLISKQQTQIEDLSKELSDLKRTKNSRNPEKCKAVGELKFKNTVC